MSLKLDRDDLLECALSALELARVAKDKSGGDISLEFRNYLVRAANAFIALAREVREGEEAVERHINVIRESVAGG